jgi:tyrosine decarboxylase
VDVGLVPLFLCATVGTTQTTAVDPIDELCAVAAPQAGVWVHVDAAYSRSVLVSPEFHHVIDGVESMDSFSMNAHKWLLANNDCCAMWAGKPCALIVVLGTDILRDSATSKVVDDKDWTPTLTCRFRALKVWLVLRCYGVDGLRGCATTSALTCVWPRHPRTR